MNRSFLMLILLCGIVYLVMDNLMPGGHGWIGKFIDKIDTREKVSA